MSYWGTGPTTSNTSPTWFSDITDAQAQQRPFHPADSEKNSATDEGWVRHLTYTDTHGQVRNKREVLVADRQLANTIGDLNVVDVRWANVASQTRIGIGNNYTFDVIFNMPVCMGAAVQWTVYTSNNAVGGGTSALASYLSGNTTNILTFVATANGTVNNTSQIPSPALVGTLEAYDPITRRAVSPVISITTGAVESINTGTMFNVNTLGTKNTTTQSSL
jgi:hypothetical protein